MATRGVNIAESEGVAVVDKSSGRVMVGGAAPRKNELIDWLQSHRSYQLHLPAGRKQSSNNKEPSGDNSEIMIMPYDAIITHYDVINTVLIALYYVMVT